MAQTLIDALVRSATHSALLAAAVWLFCRVGRGVPARIRCALWWLVAAKMIVAFAWASPLALPVLPAPRAIEALSSDSARGVSIPHRGEVIAAVSPTPAGGQRSPASLAVVGLAILWGARLVVGAAGLCADARRARRVRRNAHAAEPELGAVVRALASRLHVARVPDLRVSTEIAAPQVVGARTPAILLPARAIERLSPGELRMVLCHELAHVRRRDLWFAWVPAIANRLFFFNPIAHIACREYLLAREAACDAEVMRALGASPHAYGRLLLSLGVGPVAELAAAGGSRTFQQLERRLLMLGHASSPTSRRLALTAAALAACALLPITLTARPAGPQDTPVPAERSGQDQPVVADSARRHPTPDQIAKHTRDYSWIVLSKDGKMHMNSWGEDAALAKRQQRGSEPLLWVRRAGEQFVIRDPVLIAKASDAFREVNELGARQAAVGQQQAELGHRMSEMGAKQGAIGARQAEMGARQAEISARHAAMSAERAQRAYGETRQPDRADLEGMQHEMSDQMRIYEEQARALAQEMDALRQPMEDLAKQMQPLARQQQDLGAEMETRAAEAEAAIRTLIDQAIADGKAERVR